MVGAVELSWGATAHLALEGDALARIDWFSPWEVRPRRFPLLIPVRIGLVFGLTALVWPRWATPDVIVTQPYVGVTHTVRTETTPRPVTMHIVEIELDAPGLQFKVTPHGGPLDTYKQTTLSYLSAQSAQIAINAHFFEPWPPPSPDPGTADVVGFAASGGVVYSHFEDNPPKPHAIHANAPGLNIDATNHASIVHRNFFDPTGFTVAEPVTLHNTIAGNVQIISDGVNTTPNDSWHRDLYNARTAIGLSTDRETLFLFTVDNSGSSMGLSVYEVADLLLGPPYNIHDALALDGGGSTTLAMEDPATGVDGLLNVPSGSPRAVGSNLAVFAIPHSTDVPRGSRAAGGMASLGLAHPNPLHVSTSVELTLPRAGRIEAQIVDVAGRVVKVLANGPVECCRHRLVWDGTDEQGAPMAPGCYLLQVRHEDGVLSRKLAIVH